MHTIIVEIKWCGYIFQGDPSPGGESNEGGESSYSFRSHSDVARAGVVSDHGSRAPSAEHGHREPPPQLPELI